MFKTQQTPPVLFIYKNDKNKNTAQKQTYCFKNISLRALSLFSFSIFFLLHQPISRQQRNFFLWDLKKPHIAKYSWVVILEAFQFILVDLRF